MIDSGFKRTINWNKCQSKTTIQRQNQYLNCQIGPNFQGRNRLFVLSFKTIQNKQGTRDIFYNSINKRLQCYD